MEGRVSQKIVAWIEFSGMVDLVMRDGLPEENRNGGAPLDERVEELFGGPLPRPLPETERGDDEPRQITTHRLRAHCCPECRSRYIVAMVLASDNTVSCVWKCATEGCPIPATQFVPLSRCCDDE